MKKRLNVYIIYFSLLIAVFVLLTLSCKKEKEQPLPLTRVEQTLQQLFSTSWKIKAKYTYWDTAGYVSFSTDSLMEIMPIDNPSYCYLKFTDSLMHIWGTATGYAFKGSQYELCDTIESQKYYNVSEDMYGNLRIVFYNGNGDIIEYFTSDSLVLHTTIPDYGNAPDPYCGRKYRYCYKRI